MEYGISNILMASTAKSVGQIPAHAGIPRFAPRAATNDAISSLTPSLDTSCFTLTGIVPTLDWDVNATTCAGQNPRKNRIGLNPPANRISAPSIRNIWIAQSTYDSTRTPRSGISSFAPYVLTAFAIRESTANGVRSTTNSTTTNISLFAESMKFLNGTAASFSRSCK